MLLAIEAGDLPDPGSNDNVLPLFKNLRKEMEEKKAAGHSGGYYIGYRLREECSICGEECGQEDQSGKEDKLSKG